MMGILMEFNLIYFAILVLIAVQFFYFRILKLNIKNSNNCLETFKSNNFLGLLIFIALFTGKNLI